MYIRFRGGAQRAQEKVVGCEIVEVVDKGKTLCVARFVYGSGD
jgi:hypothetical protein